MHKSAGFCGFAAAGTAQATANTKAADSHTQLLSVSEETNAFSNLKGVMQAVCQISQRSPADLSSQSDEVFKIYQNFLRKLGNWVSNRPREMDNNRAKFEQEMPRIVIAIVFVTGYVGELLQEVRDNSPYDEVLPKPFQLNELVEVVNWPPPTNE